MEHTITSSALSEIRTILRPYLGTLVDTACIVALEIAASRLLPIGSDRRHARLHRGRSESISISINYKPTYSIRIDGLEWSIRATDEGSNGADYGRGYVPCHRYSGIYHGMFGAIPPEKEIVQARLITMAARCRMRACTVLQESCRWSRRKDMEAIPTVSSCGRDDCPLSCARCFLFHVLYGIE